MKPIHSTTGTSMTAPEVKKVISSALIALSLLATSVGTAVGAEWPAKIFAPYMQIDAGNHFKLTNCYNACGVKYYTLAFFKARQERTNGEAKYYKEPSWSGRMPVEQSFYKDQIDAI